MTAHLLRRNVKPEPARGHSPRSRARGARTRKLRLEQLEGRNLLTALPYGAYPDDTGEYLLGDVHVTVVLMESDPTLAPKDNLSIPAGGIGAPAENWDAAAISAVKSNIQAGMNWWKQTIDALPTVRDGLLNFTYDWTYADNPVETGYEPIARISNNFSLWMYDFLNGVNFNQSGNFSSDIRAFNNFQRQQNNADWAFTIFVVNNATDSDKLFAPGGSFARAFAFAGGQFMVVPADRPASTYAHEAGHMFWALDEYSGASTHTARRGYYYTANTNAFDNPGNPPDNPFVQQPSIMANGALLDQAYAANTSSTSSLEMIGWRDSDNDGIFDVLDVPFTLTGTGRYDAANSRYRFIGNSNVNTLPNSNLVGLGNDITINRIRQVEYQINNGGWIVHPQTFPDRTYSTALDLSIPLAAGNHTIRIRTVDTRTGVVSNEFVGTTAVPKATPTPGASGFVWRDDDADGTWDASEPALADWAVNLVDNTGAQIQIQQIVEPNPHPEGTLLNNIAAGAVLSAVGSDTINTQVLARTSSIILTAGKVFAHNAVSTGSVQETWNATRRLRVDFPTPVNTVSLRALSSGSTSIGRLEAYQADGTLLARYTTNGLSANKTELMTLSRSTSEIGYVIAYGHMGTNVLLDTLTWGAGASATTNAQGYWSLPNLTSGSYRVRIAVPTNHLVTTSAGAIATFPFTTGQVASDLNFGLRVDGAFWRNPTFPENVTGDSAGLVNAFDLLAIVNWITANPGNATLPTSGQLAGTGFVDVDGNGLCNALDLLAVINYIIAHPPGLGGGGEGEAALGFVPASTNTPAAGEGEAGLPLAPPRTAAEYYATNPFHVLEIPGTELPCCCSQCVAETMVESHPEVHHAVTPFVSALGGSSAGQAADRQTIAALGAAPLAPSGQKLATSTVKNSSWTTSRRTSVGSRSAEHSTLRTTSAAKSSTSPAKTESTLDAQAADAVHAQSFKVKVVRRGVRR